MLEITGLTVAYGSLRAVQGIDLRAEEGELVTLVGANGAGKSSTLAAIAGLIRPESGTISYQGRTVTAQAPESLVRQGLCLVPEGRHILAGLTVQENLLLGAAGRRGRRTIAADLAAACDRFPILGERRKQHAGLLSGGEQQQLAIARALMARPRMLLLDEPSLGLAPKMVDLVLSTISALRAEGMTILLVEQNAAQAMAISDRGYVMRGGRVIRSGTAAQLAGTLAADYLGDSDFPEAIG